MSWLLLITPMVLPSFALEGRAPTARAPLLVNASYRRAVALDLAGRYREALPYYLRASTRAGRARHHVALTRGMLDSLDHLRRFPQDARIHFRLGVDAANKLSSLRRETGVVVRTFFVIAERAFLRAQRLMPGAANPAICLAGLYADASLFGLARAAIATIRERRLRAGEIYNLACYYHSMGEYEKALRLLRRVINGHYRRWILSSDDFYELRGDPRFERVLLQAPAKGVR